jgi:hypothetical protein
MANALTVDYREDKPQAWKASTINEAAMALYGRDKFSTIQKSTEIELIVPTGIVKDREEIPVTIRTSMKAKTVALFQDVNPESLVAVFHVHEESIIDYEFNIRMAFKGTVFAVVEGIDEKLYYTRAYVDILTMSCMA